MSEILDFLRWIIDCVILIGLVVIIALARKYLPEYLSQKAKNLATQEDIAGITHEIEAAKIEYAMQFEHLKDVLERKRATTSAHRERVATTLSQALSEYSDLAVTLSLSERRVWFQSVDLLEADERVLTSIEKLMIQVQILSFIKATPEEITNKILARIYHVKMAWAEVQELMTHQRRVASDPDSTNSDFSFLLDKESKIFDRLHSAQRRLVEVISALPSNTSYES